MRGCGASSEAARGLVVLTALGVLLGAVSCAGTRRAATLPSEDVDRAEPRPVAPAPGAGKDLPPVPGADRVYPSDDPRNRPSSGAPEAFPLPGGVPFVPPRATTETPRVKGEAAVPPRVGSTPTGFAVQLFASRSRAMAEERAREIAARLGEPVEVREENGLFKARIGAMPGRSEAERLRRRAIELGFRDAFVVERTARDEETP